MIDAYPDPVPTRPLWLMTLADLALLLVGFLVLMQATQTVGGKAMAKGIRDGFGRTEAMPLPVAAAEMIVFAPGSAALPAVPTTLVDWTRAAVRDPRVALTVTGSTDGSAADVESATGSAAILAADRARVVAAALAHIAPDRVTIATTTIPGRRAAIVTLAFVGEDRKTP